MYLCIILGHYDIWNVLIRENDRTKRCGHRLLVDPLMLGWGKEGAQDYENDEVDGADVGERLMM